MGIGVSSSDHESIATNMELKPKKSSINDDYTTNSKEILGEGINGKVITCVNKITNEKYALKILKDTPKARSEIDLQWRACQGCDYIVKIKDVYENIVKQSKCLLIVMEYMRGGEVFAKITRREKPFTEQEVAKMMFEICSAVKHLHDMNIAHRDLKPENLLLSTNDQFGVIKLADFGFAKETNSGLQTPCYTPYYVAPEVLGSGQLTSKTYDISCDIWSLGVIMYILCCGYPPFYSTHGQPISPGMKKRIRAGEYTFPEQEWRMVSDEAKQLIRGMLHTVPEERLTINQIMRSRWISQYVSVPQTPLPSIDILREEAEQWGEVTTAMNVALNEMRVNYDKKINIRDVNDVENPLLKKRREKDRQQNNTGATQTQNPSNLPTITEMNSVAE